MFSAYEIDIIDSIRLYYQLKYIRKTPLAASAFYLFTNRQLKTSYFIFLLVEGSTSKI
jgi:hypothetical protein